MACSALGTGSSCGSPGEGTCVITWHVNQHCMGTIRTDQIPEPTKQTGEVVIRERPRVWSTYLVVAWFGVRLPADSHQTSRSVISQRDRCSLHWPSLVKYKCLGHTRFVDFWNTWQNTVWFRFFFLHPCTEEQVISLLYLSHMGHWDSVVLTSPICDENMKSTVQIFLNSRNICVVFWGLLVV